MLQLLSGENWNDTMYSAVAGSGLSSVFYFFVVYTVGNLVIVNLIIAVLIDNCQDDHVEKEEEEVRELSLNLPHLPAVCCRATACTRCRKASCSQRNILLNSAIS